jgi:hypothetical protein
MHLMMKLKGPHTCMITGDLIESTAVLPTDNETRHGVLRPTMKRVPK